jgi:GNAT superfamily N-acetyltransferase
MPLGPIRCRTAPGKFAPREWQPACLSAKCRCRAGYGALVDGTDQVLLRDTYDEQLRAWVPARLPDGATVERDGPIVRVTGLDEGGFVTYVSLAGLSSAQVDELIARQRDHYAALGMSVEWKLHGHDEPADLPDRLRAAGFVPQDQETVLIGPAAPLASRDPALPEGIRLQEVTARADLDRIDVMERVVWGADRSDHAPFLEAELASDPMGTTVVVAETAAGEVVCAGWVRYVHGTSFATLWGGSTLPNWRQRGIYHALVAYRAQLALDRGHSLLQVDASDNSRPILVRSGFVVVTTTTPYVFTPDA